MTTEDQIQGVTPTALARFVAILHRVWLAYLALLKDDPAFPDDPDYWLQP